MKDYDKKEVNERSRKSINNHQDVPSESSPQLSLFLSFQVQPVELQCRRRRHH